MIDRKMLIKKLVKLKETYKICFDNKDDSKFLEGAHDSLNIVIEYLNGLKD